MFLIIQVWNSLTMCTLTRLDRICSIRVLLAGPEV